MKLCKDCRYCRRAWFPIPWASLEFAKCKSPEMLKLSKPDLVDGSMKPHYNYCSTWRITDDADGCGPEGKWFEPKTEKEAK